MNRNTIRLALNQAKKYAEGSCVSIDPNNPKNEVEQAFLEELHLIEVALKELDKPKRKPALI